MQQSNIVDRDTLSQTKNRFKCKVRDDQEVGRWKKEEHENFIKGMHQLLRIILLKQECSPLFIEIFENSFLLSLFEYKIC